jgi:hypothetical protein
MDSTDFCVFITEICILLFILVYASKLRQLLIINDAYDTNRIQREFDSNVRIATFDHKTFAPKNKLSQTLACFCSLRQRFGEGLGMGYHADTNRIQREFLFNNCIHSHSIVLASNYTRKKTNFFKRFAPFLCEAGEGLGMGDFATSILDYPKMTFLSKLPSTPYFVNKA